MTGERNRISPLDLERWLLGEQDQEQRERVERALSVEDCRRIRAQDQALRKALFERRPPGAFAASISASASVRREPPRTRLPVLGALAIPALAAIAIAVWTAPTWRKVEPPSKAGVLSTQAGEGDRAKGLKPRLLIYRKHGSRAELLAHGASVKAGDVLQIGYVAAGRPYGVVISIDGAGAVTLHAPSAPSLSSALMPGSGEHTLPTAYELDHAPHYERFFFIVSREPIAPNDIMTVAREFAKKSHQATQKSLPLAPGIEQYSLILLKTGF
jgi:hypothetical protein